MATLYEPSGNVSEWKPKNGRAFELDELQAVVGGDIEIVYLPDGRPMVINEEGKLDGLPLNNAATALVDLAGDYIVGNALLCADGEID